MNWIEDRILSERRKYDNKSTDIDWIKMASIKIGNTMKFRENQLTKRIKELEQLLKESKNE